jgi:hypothetical protein
MFNCKNEFSWRKIIKNWLYIFMGEKFFKKRSRLHLRGVTDGMRGNPFGEAQCGMIRCVTVRIRGVIDNPGKRSDISLWRKNIVQSPG